MNRHGPHPMLHNPMLPVEIVLAPAWWHRHAGIVFDRDFFFHPAKRVEVERKMEQVLHDRWGRYGLGADHDKTLPVVGPVHLAAGFLLSEMLGCEVEYVADGPPVVKPANRPTLELSPDIAFESTAYRRWDALCDVLRKKHGGLVGDVDFNGVLNLALDVRGQSLFLDMLDQPEQVVQFFNSIATVMEQYSKTVQQWTGSTSISVNRSVRYFSEPVFLHSACSLVMISVSDYEHFLKPFDVTWSTNRRPFGIHYCGRDPHRFAAAFASLPHLDFLDVGWGGDVAALRRALPNTFLNIRYSPVEIAKHTPDEIRHEVRRLVHESADLLLTGVCCINMDQQVSDNHITALFEEAETLREEYMRSNR